MAVVVIFYLVDYRTLFAGQLAKSLKLLNAIRVPTHFAGCRDYRLTRNTVENGFFENARTMQRW